MRLDWRSYVVPPKLFTCSLQIDFDDVAAINPELLQLLPLHPKDNLPLQENVTVQVGACHVAEPVLQVICLACWLLLIFWDCLGLKLDTWTQDRSLNVDRSHILWWSILFFRNKNADQSTPKFLLQRKVNGFLLAYCHGVCAWSNVAGA